MALHAYTCLHLPMVAGIVLFALGLKMTLGGVVCSLVVAYEVLRYRADRIVIRHPELAAVLLLCLLVAGCGDGSAPLRKPDLLVFGVAPDYDEIAYDIVAVRPDGRGRRILTRGAPGDAHHPHWSPDGRHIAFDLTESVPPESSLHVMDADGTDRRRLVPKRDGYSHAVGWSPDGKDILYVLTQPYKTSAALWAIGVEGTGKRRLGPNTWEASWSPDGSTIAYVAASAIHLLDVRERRSRLLVRGGDSPRWAPDSTRIVFTREFQGNRSGIYVVERDGGSPWLLSRLRGDEDPYLGEVSPDGSSVLVGYHPGISRISLDDGKLQKLTSGRSDWGPAWSPDGKRIAFERGGNIWVMDAEGRDEHVVVRAPRLAVYDRPHWRPSS